MSKALLSFGVGDPYEELHAIALPSLREFSERHGYKLLTGNRFVGLPGFERPLSWLKIPAIQEALEIYDEVLFVGADIVIVDVSQDLDVPWWAWQALVTHRTSEGDVPNADMWLVRRAMFPFLHQIWEMTEHMHHGWWEQRALIELMGYEGPPFHSVTETDLYLRTFFLDSGFNVHRHDTTLVTHERFMHATMWPDRAEIMRQWAD